MKKPRQKWNTYHGGQWRAERIVSHKGRSSDIGSVTVYRVLVRSAHYNDLPHVLPTRFRTWAAAKKAAEKAIRQGLHRENPSTNWLLVGGGVALAGVAAYLIFRKPTPPALTP